MITQRQPLRPNRVVGTSIQDISATAGTERNWMKKAKAKALLRRWVGTHSLR